MHRVFAHWSQIAASVITARNVIGSVVIIGGVAISALGMMKVPAQQREIAAALAIHNGIVIRSDSEQQKRVDGTNRRLDAIICISAKLDTPLGCVAKLKLEH